jgi:arginyl-tRNA synthetase
MYVVDNRHSLHFKQLFHVAKKANITIANLEHISFGTINGTDGKPYKTRDGGVMRLREFIDQAYSMAAKEAGYDIDNVDAETSKMIFDIGLGAIKFADLCNPRTSDYIFSPDSVKFIGKTGPYIQYTYVRCKSILKCYDEISETSEIFSEIKTFSHPTERALCMALINFNEDLQSAFEKRMPHILCDYVYTLCQKFSSFYAECPVLGENDPDIKSFRLFLVHKTSVTIKKVLDCLAIPAPEKMTRA